MERHKLQMKTLNEIVGFVSGSPQFRIKESFDKKAPLYHFYNQMNLSDDLIGFHTMDDEGKRIHTSDKVSLLKTGDIVYSLISGTAAIVGKFHNNYLYTQNYVKLIPGHEIVAEYLVYLLNEDKSIRKQYAEGLQGSQVLKYTLKQVKELNIYQLPLIEKQNLAGDVYLKQLRLQALKKRVAESETMIRLKQLEEVIINERKSI